MSKKIHSRVKSKANLQYLKKKIKIKKERKEKQERKKVLLKRIAYCSVWIPLCAYAIYRLFA